MAELGPARRSSHQPGILHPRAAQVTLGARHRPVATGDHPVGRAARSEGPAPGCAFAPRCPSRSDECEQAMPEMTMLSVTSSVACLHPAEIGADPYGGLPCSAHGRSPKTGGGGDGCARPRRAQEVRAEEGAQTPRFAALRGISLSIEKASRWRWWARAGAGSRRFSERSPGSTASTRGASSSAEPARDGLPRCGGIPHALAHGRRADRRAPPGGGFRAATPKVAEASPM